jgi:UDP-2,3-diacylglucosamine hydrolase
VAWTSPAQYTARVPVAVIVSDAHLGRSTPPEAFLRFLASVPDLGGHLVVNGDLFDFWFEYRTVVPRRAFPVVSALHRLAGAGIRLTVTGGNHDRWGRTFWREEVGATFHPDGGRLAVAGWRCAVLHGDGVNETHVAARILHTVTRWPVTAAAFRWLHPDLGLRLVDVLSGRLARQTRHGAVLERAAAAQAAWARDFLGREPDVDVLIMGHTHRAALDPVGPGRWYVNPGAWCEGGRYALLTETGPLLRRFEPA